MARGWSATRLAARVWHGITHKRREWRLLLLAVSGKLLGGSFLAWLEGPPVLVSTSVLTDVDGRALRRTKGEPRAYSG